MLKIIDRFLDKDNTKSHVWDNCPRIHVLNILIFMNIRTWRTIRWTFWWTFWSYKCSDEHSD